MKPSIDQTSFGSITIEGTIFEHDVIIRLNGLVEKRKKKLSKAVYGTSSLFCQIGYNKRKKIVCLPVGGKKYEQGKTSHSNRHLRR